MSPMRCRSISSFPGRTASPNSEKPECVRQCPTSAGRISGQYSSGRVVIGIREISRDLQLLINDFGGGEHFWGHLLVADVSTISRVAETGS